MEQEGAVHQGIVGHLRWKEGVNTTSITAPGVPGKGAGAAGGGKNTGPGLKAHIADPWERLHRRPASHLVSSKNSDTAPGNLDQLHVTSKLHPVTRGCELPSQAAAPTPRHTHRFLFQGRPWGPRKPPGRS